MVEMLSQNRRHQLRRKTADRTSAVRRSDSSASLLPWLLQRSPGCRLPRGRRDKKKEKIQMAKDEQKRHNWEGDGEEKILKIQHGKTPRKWMDECICGRLTKSPSFRSFLILWAMVQTNNENSKINEASKKNQHQFIVSWPLWWDLTASTMSSLNSSKSKSFFPKEKEGNATK